MTARRAFLQKEFLEFVRTWRIWVLIIPVVAFALGGPIFVHYSPYFFETTIGSYADVDVIVPPPTWVDSAMQWVNNLKKIIPIVLLVIAGSAVANECNNRTCIPILTGGLKRRDFVLIKFAVISVLALSAIAIGSILNWFVSTLVFPGTPFKAPLAIIGVAGLLALMLIALAILASTFMPDALSSVGLEMLLFISLAGATLWEPARKYSPAGLLTILSDLVDGNEVNAVMPALSTVVFTIVLLGMAVTIFQRREL